MNIRNKLIFWFSIAAIVPAAVIALFVTNDAGERFVSRARQELDHATERGLGQIVEMEREVKTSVQGVLLSAPMMSYLERVREAGAGVVDASLAQRIKESLDSRLDFIKVLDDQGIVISSLEWLVFAGKEDLEWEQLSQIQTDRFIVGGVRTDGGDFIGIRYLTRLEEFTIVGGVVLDERDLGRFGAAQDIVVYLYDGVRDELISSNPVPGLSKEMILNSVYRQETADAIEVDGDRYLLSYFHLDPARPATGSIIFLYSSAPLHDEITSLWISFIITAAVGVLLATLLGVGVSTGVSQPLKKLLYAFELVSLGDFTHTLETSRKDELGEILRSFNNTTDDLRRLQSQLIRSERMAAWQEIARKIAHEIKNPLSPIQISIETMRKVYERSHPDFEKIFNQSSDTILEEVDKIRTIVQEFSDFARMPEPHFADVRIDEVIRHIVTLYQHQEDGVEWEVDVQESLPAVWADVNQLRRALINVVKNSLEAMEEGGKLSVSARYQRSGNWKKAGRKPGKVIIRVSDTGSGISREDQQRVFTPYFTTKESGTGLGLVIVQKIVELHRGRLNLHSETGRGTTIEIALPGKS